jgi:hypothetical protein
MDSTLKQNCWEVHTADKEMLQVDQKRGSFSSVENQDLREHATQKFA